MERLVARQLIQIAILLLAMYLVQLVSVVTGGWPMRFGILPRTAVGLRGILFSPLLHVSWSHLIANTVPLAVMLCLLALSRRGELWKTTAALWALSGAGVWLAGRPNSMQIGASGLIFGLAAFLITVAWRSRSLGSALAAFVVIFLYSNIIWGVLPGRRGVSWEGHLCGAVAGVVLARWIGSPKP